MIAARTIDVGHLYDQLAPEPEWWQRPFRVPVPIRALPALEAARVFHGGRVCPCSRCRGQRRRPRRHA